MKWRNWLRSWLCFSSSFKSFGLFFGTIAIVKIQILMMPEAFVSRKRENFFKIHRLAFTMELPLFLWYPEWRFFFIKLKSENPFGTKMNEKVICCPVFLRSMRNANLTWRAWKRHPGELQSRKFSTHPRHENGKTFWHLRLRLEGIFELFAICSPFLTALLHHEDTVVAELNGFTCQSMAAPHKEDEFMCDAWLCLLNSLFIALWL